MSSSASVTEYNHLCALIQPRMNMLCQFEQGGREREREGKVKENCESQGNKTKKRYMQTEGAATLLQLHHVQVMQDTCPSTHSRQKL